MILDADLIRRRRDELRLSQRQLAAQIGATGAVVRGLEAGTNHTTITVGMLDLLARALAVEPGTLFVRDSVGEPAESLDADVAMLGAALRAVDTSIPVSTLAAEFSWSPQRIHAAIAALSERLAGCGIRVRHVAGRLSIERSVEAIDRVRLQRVVRAHLSASGLSVLEARVLHQVMSGTLPRELSNAEHVALGVIINAGLVEVGEAPDTEEQRQRTSRLADDAYYATLAS